MSVYDHIEPIPGVSPDIEQLALYFAKIITSPHNQHAIVMFVGQAGLGKSWAATKLAIEVAKYVSIILKEGTPEDYFNFKDTFATINRDEVKRVMTKPKKYSVILLDDIGVGWNARKYKDEFNIFLNDIIQTFRPNHNLVIMTMQASFLIDKVPRSLAHYLIEMDEARFEQGFTLAKVFKITLKHRLGKLYYPYLSIGGIRYYRHIFRMPPAKLMKEYEAIRAEQLERLATMRENFEKAPAEYEEKVKVRKLEMMRDVWKRLRDEGYSLRKIGEITSHDFGTIGRELRRLDEEKKHGGVANG